MRNHLKKTRIPMLSALMLLLSLSLAYAGDAPISIDQLKNNLDDPGLIIIDVRTASDWDNSDSKIKGAVRQIPADYAMWSKEYKKDQKIVLYCA